MRKRKKDIKSKYEPEEFAIELIEQLVAVFPQGVEAVGKQLESLGDKVCLLPSFEVVFNAPRALFSARLQELRRDLFRRAVHGRHARPGW